MAEVRVNQNAPHQGELLRDYELTRADGSKFPLSDFRGKLNLAIFLFADAAVDAGTQLLRQLAQHAEQLHHDETRIIAVFRAAVALPKISLPPELIAASGASGKAFAEAAAGGETAIYFTDKFREIFKVYRIAPGAPLPTSEDVLSWVSFVAMQCPECHPPEWPADAL